MVNIDFYNYQGEKVVINKPIENPTRIIGLFVQPFDFLNPDVKLRFSGNFNFNYCFIHELNKYYFVDSVEIEGTNVFKISLSLDVLKTYETEILNSSALIVSRENGANPYLSTRENIYSRLPKFEKLSFSRDTPFNEEGKIIMITLKGNS